MVENETKCLLFVNEVHIPVQTIQIPKHNHKNYRINIETNHYHIVIQNVSKYRYRNHSNLWVTVGNKETCENRND